MAGLIILAGAVTIGLLESLAFKVWCDYRRWRFSSLALFMVILGAILGAYGGAILAGIIGNIAPQVSARLLMDIFCKGEAGALGMCLWFAAVVSIGICAIVGSLFGGWLGFQLWRSRYFS